MREVGESTQPHAQHSLKPKVMRTQEVSVRFMVFSSPLLGH